MSVDPELRHPAWDLGPLPAKESVRWRRGMTIVAAVVAVPLVAVLVYGFAPATSFSSHALAYSVAGATDAHAVLESTPCSRLGDRVWQCEVGEYNNVSYLVEMDGSRCWHARRLESGRDFHGNLLPREVSDCLKIHDQVRFSDRV